MEKMSTFFAGAVATRIEFRTAKSIEDVDRLLDEQT